MGKIRLLEKHVSEMIAAGEVVERPASAVKELMENSIDAGSSAVTVEIRNGGIALIRITDNGCGIAAEDVERAFLRHATSKVYSPEDLEAIGTLGFRGEALASIAAVSRVEIITRTKEELAGTSVKLEGGEILSRGEAGCPAGTTLIVRDLFYNTPARMKFLKKDATEASAVHAVVERIALSHPEISVRFLKDGKEELQTPGDNRLISAVHAVFGREFARGLIPADYQLEGIGVGGYVSRPAAARPNRSMQLFFINGRFVKSRTVMAALEEACKHSIMVGKFPACVLMLTMNYGLVDVNVHPAKTEVRFANERNVFDAVYYAVKTSLAKNDTRPEFAVKPREQGGGLPENSPAEAPQLRFDAAKMAGQRPEPADAVESSARASYVPAQNESHAGFSGLPAAESAAFRAAPERLPRPEIPEAERLCAVSTPAKASPYKILGEAFDTYVIVQSGDELLLIDKHAAHERILYEQLKSGGKSSGQLLLNPVSVVLSAGEHEALLENAEELARAGFRIEDFGGNAVLVREAPMALRGGDIGDAVQEIAGYLVQGSKNPVPERIEWLYHSVACRAAVKAGDKTSLMETEKIVSRVMEFGDIRYCPHGRPVAAVLSRKDIEKRFGRT